MLSCVASSRRSAPVSAPSTVAASATVRQIGPTVSWVWEIGTTPARLVRPTVGLMPTTPLTDDGQTIDPLVSVPSVAVARLAAAAAAEPELEPQGERSRTYGLTPWRPRPLQPLHGRVERKLAHSLRLALPRMTAPASRSRCVTVASWWGRAPGRTGAPGRAGVRCPPRLGLLLGSPGGWDPLRSDSKSDPGRTRPGRK